MVKSRKEIVEEKKVKEAKKGCSCTELRIYADHRNDNTTDRGLVMQCKACGKLHE